MYNDQGMAEQGSRRDAADGNLRDVIVRRLADNGVVSVTPGDRLSVAYARMRMYGVSQLPVLEGKTVVGILDESDLLLAIGSGPHAFQATCGEVMTTRLIMVSSNAAVCDLLQILDAGGVVVVCDERGFHGLITRVDVLNYLRRQALAA